LRIDVLVPYNPLSMLIDYVTADYKPNKKPYKDAIPQHSHLQLCTRNW
jgi:hypothetical protein